MGNADANDFELAEDTDLNEEELDLNVSRKMSIRALHVATMHRFSPGSIKSHPANSLPPQTARIETSSNAYFGSKAQQV